MYPYERIRLFTNMIRCCHNMYLWNLDGEFGLVSSNCPEEQVYYALLNLDQIRDYMLAYRAEHSAPVIITNSLSLIWIAVCEKDAPDGAFRPESSGSQPFHLLGPFFVSEDAPKALEKNFHERTLSPDVFRDAVSFLRQIPIISVSKVTEYALMFHYAVNEEALSISDLTYCDAQKPSHAARPETDQSVSHATYEAEREMLRMVREGDLNFEEQISRMLNMGNVGRLTGKTSDRQWKNTVLVGIVLFSRAAIEGGLSPEEAMSLTDHYFQIVEDCQTVSELTDISRQMQRDFIERVNRVRKNNAYSKPVKDCCNYLYSHIELPFSMEEMGRELGYTGYYLSRKFKKETGTSVNRYLLLLRIERAKYLLKETSLSIGDISERLQFNSQSHFTECFRTEEHLAPGAWRERNALPK